MFLIKNARFLLESDNFGRLKSFSAEILNLIDSKVERLWNHFVGEVLVWLFGRVLGSEPKKKCSLFELLLEMFRHFSILHFYLIEIFRGKILLFRERNSNCTHFCSHTLWTYSASKQAISHWFLPLNSVNKPLNLWTDNLIILFLFNEILFTNLYF